MEEDYSRNSQNWKYLSRRVNEAILMQLLGYFNISDTRLRRRLIAGIKKTLHKDHLDFGPQITYAMEYAKKKFEKDFNKYLRHLRKVFKGVTVTSDLVESTIYSVSLGFIQKVDSQDKKFKNLVSDIKFYDSIFLIGAGVSFETKLPLTKHMLPLVKDALSHDDSDEDWKKGYINPKTNEIKDECWKKIKENPKCFAEFKKKFKQLVERKWERRQRNSKMFSAHRLLVKYFRKEEILEIICFNWDNLIELEYIRIVHREISKITGEGEIKPHSLWKLHGDVEDIEGGWVLPHESGRIFNSLIQYLNSLKGTPIYVIIGYSERETNIATELIAKMEREGVLYRIRPDFDPYEAKRCEISSTAMYALKKIDELMADG